MMTPTSRNLTDLPLFWFPCVFSLSLHRNRHRFVLVCVGLGVAIGSVLLVPTTIVCHDILLLFPNNYYLQWLSRHLVYTIWNHMFWASNISMFALLPLAYFYHEAAGFGSQFKSSWWRMFEAVVLWVLFSAILGGSVYLARSLYTVTHSSPDYSPFAYSLMSLVGSLFILWYTPGGIVVLGRASTNLFRTYKVLVPANRQELLFERDALKFRLFKLESQQQLGEEASQARFSSSPSFNPYSTHSTSSGIDSDSSSHSLPPNPTDTIWTKFSLLPTSKRSMHRTNSRFPALSGESRFYPNGHSPRSSDGYRPGDWLSFTNASQLAPARSLQRASRLQQQLIKSSASKSRRKSAASWGDDDDWEWDPPSPAEFLSPATRRKALNSSTDEDDLPFSALDSSTHDQHTRKLGHKPIPITSNVEAGAAQKQPNEADDDEDEAVFRHQAVTPELLETDEYASRAHTESQNSLESLRWIIQHSNSVAMAANRSRAPKRSSSPSEGVAGHSGDSPPSAEPSNEEDLSLKIDYHNQYAVTQEVDWLEAQQEYSKAAHRLKLVQRELAKYAQEPERVTIMSSFRWFLRNLLAVLLTAVNLALPLLLFIRAIEVQLRPYLATEAYYYSFLYPDETSSTVWFTSEIALIVYLTTAAFSGLFSSSFMERFKPQRHNTGMHKVIVCIFFSLVLASAVPVTGHLLGLISFDLMGAYDNLEFLQSKYLANGIQMLFALLLFKRYLEFFPWTNYLFQTVGRAFEWANSPFALH